MIRVEVEFSAGAVWRENERGQINSRMRRGERKERYFLVLINVMAPVPGFQRGEGNSGEFGTVSCLQRTVYSKCRPANLFLSTQRARVLHVTYFTHDHIDQNEPSAGVFGPPYLPYPPFFPPPPPLFFPPL